MTPRKAKIGTRPDGTQFVLLPKAAPSVDPTLVAELQARIAALEAQAAARAQQPAPVAASPDLAAQAQIAATSKAMVDTATIGALSQITRLVESLAGRAAALEAGQAALAEAAARDAESTRAALEAALRSAADTVRASAERATAETARVMSVVSALGARLDAVAAAIAAAKPDTSAAEAIAALKADLDRTMRGLADVSARLSQPVKVTVTRGPDGKITGAIKEGST